MPARRTPARSRDVKPVKSTSRGVAKSARASSKAPAKPKLHAPTLEKAKALAAGAPMTLALAETLWEHAFDKIKHKKDIPSTLKATLKHIASGGGKGEDAFDVGDDAARWLTVKINATFGTDGAYDSETTSPTKSTKRNLSERFDPGEDTEDEVVSDERAAKRRKLTRFEKTLRFASKVFNLGDDANATLMIYGKAYDKDACEMVMDSMNVLGKVGLTCAKGVTTSLQERSARFGLSQKSMDTLLMFANGGVGDFKINVDEETSAYLRRVVEDEKSLGPEVLSPTPKRRTGMLWQLRDYARPKQYRVIDGVKYDAAVCELANRSMEHIGRIDLACARDIVESVKDGAVITPTEVATLQMLIAGGREDVLFIVDEDARVCLLKCMGISSKVVAKTSASPSAVEVQRNAPASSLHSALKKVPMSALKKPIAAPSTKKKGVVFTPARRFETRTYVPSPENSTPYSDASDSDDDDYGTPVVEEEVIEEQLEPKWSARKGAYTKPRTPLNVRFVRAVKKSSEFWLMPVSVYDTVAACLCTITTLCLVHFGIVAWFQATIPRETLDNFGA